MLLPGLESAQGPRAAVAFSSAIRTLAEALAARVGRNQVRGKHGVPVVGSAAEAFSAGLVSAYEELGPEDPSHQYCTRARELALVGVPQDVPWIDAADEGDTLALAVVLGGARLESSSAQLLMQTVADKMVTMLPLVDGLALVELAHVYANYSASVPRPKTIGGSFRGEDLDHARAKGVLPRADMSREMRSNSRRTERVLHLAGFKSKEAMAMLDLELATRVPLAKGHAQLEVMLQPFLRARMYAPKLTHAIVTWMDTLRSERPERFAVAFPVLVP